MDPPSIPPPPPPPPPLNIPPSRARLQLAARLAMHQKKEQESTSDDEENPTDPFADTEEDFGDEPQDRGAWWRDVKRDGNESDDEEEFGDFEMPENAAGDEDKEGDKVVRPQPRSLWPFGLSKAETDKAEGVEVKEAKEAKRRTSIEDPDDDDEVVV
ncbi:sporulation-induced protein [Fusarium equiseti]|uniref:Sporulation-induced protein n=1 Tax=Fusarium equiseti TaxID=61235 RepID=A0ABQ8R159_FUSEQ|nr:sporulation-induced protein [Fusarium equiseti]